MILKKITPLLIAVLLTPLAAAQTKQELNDQMFEAVRAGDAAKVTALLDKGADVNAKFRYGTTALFKAAERGYLEVAKVLVDRGVDVKVKDTFYGQNAISWALQNDHDDVVRVILVKDPESVDDVLITGVRGGNVTLVEIALAQGGAKPETLSSALVVAMNDKDKAALAEMLKKAGALPPPEIDVATLQTYVGKYKDDKGTEVNIDLKDGKLSATVVGQAVIALSAIDKVTFKPAAFEGIVITMTVENGKAVSFTLKQRGTSGVFKRVE